MIFFLLFVFVVRFLWWLFCPPPGVNVHRPQSGVLRSEPTPKPRRSLRPSRDIREIGTTPCDCAKRTTPRPAARWVHAALATSANARGAFGTHQARPLATGVGTGRGAAHAAAARAVPAPASHHGRTRPPDTATTGVRAVGAGAARASSPQGLGSSYGRTPQPPDARRPARAPWCGAHARRASAWSSHCFCARQVLKSRRLYVSKRQVQDNSLS